MSPNQLLDFFVCIAPCFKVDWYSDDNYSIRDDGSFTFHGVCTEFSQYFIDQESHKYVSLHDIKWKPDMPESNVKILFDWLEDHIEDVETKESLRTNEGLLSNAICTCFLENISQTNAGEHAKKFMGKKSGKYFNFWHTYSNRL